MLLVTGFGLTAFSLWQMSNYALILSQGDIIWPGVIQGFGLGLVFVPLSASTFATLSPEMRAQGTAMYSLIRNIGSSVGIALVQTLLVRNSQIAHSSIVAQINTISMSDPGLSTFYNLYTTSGLAALNEEVTRQAAMIAYVDDYKLMLLLTLLVMPLLFLIKPPKRNNPPVIDHAAME
jgi:DHA2 family multidrug resistance protein